MMIRLRKYRIFLAVTLCCFFAVYLLSRRSPQYSPENLPPFGTQPPIETSPNQGGAFSPETHSVAEEENQNPGTSPTFDNPDGLKTDDLPSVPKPGAAPTNMEDDESEEEGPDHHKSQNNSDQESTTTSEVPATTLPMPQWSPKPESFPVPTESIIPLPTGAPKSIPKIQHTFPAETTEQKTDRQRKQEKIKAAAQRTWGGYREFAWMKDELKPQSGSFRNRFGGWAATLVDSLDTLWIMGMKDEFEEAVKAAQGIDFTTNEQTQIPVFETTIRYLGGFLGAYDVSGGTYNVLLDKAKELAEVLIGAFDTPNRMPHMYFAWEGDRRSNPVRASAATVLAEIGSISLEFTRLAQITQDSKYYDAVARITNGLQAAQNNTQLPGMWPLFVDASGCGFPNDEDEEKDSQTYEDKERLKDKSSFGVDETIAVEEPRPLTEKEKHQKDKSSFGDDATHITKRQIHRGQRKRANSRRQTPTKVQDDDCFPVGIQTTKTGGQFTLGGQADSTYEYLPKEYILLGGLNNQLRTMYDDATSAMEDHLFFRAMIPDEKRKLLFTGKFHPIASESKPESKPKPEESDEGQVVKGRLTPSVGHLTCFQGGMFALGAKIFDRPSDLTSARYLTDACVWAYESSPSGIMPEDMTALKCPSADECPWNESAWWLTIDPDAASRPSEEHQSKDSTEKRADGDFQGRDVKDESLTKRQPKETEPIEHAESSPKGSTSSLSEKMTAQPRSEELDTERETRVHEPTHAEVVQKRIKSEGLWPGLTSVDTDKYILRPEAIESVWYLYRITGEDYWREKGWKMFEAIEEITRVPFGNSAITGVTSGNPIILDEAESFWTAETLKYFYLLFSDPNVISLDDYVLNTEAHPLLRPDAQKR